MAKPIVTPTAQETYDELVPWNAADPSTDWHLLRFVDAITKHLDKINFLVRDRDDRPGWSIVMDADHVPVEYLPWLGQFVGVTVDAGLSEEDQRRQVKDTQGFRRGTVAAMKAAARPYLTGSKAVRILERDTSPYHFSVRTFDAETPDPAKVLTALLSEKPAGLMMEYQVDNGMTYSEIAASGLTYADLDAYFPTSDDMKNAESI